MAHNSSGMHARISYIACVVWWCVLWWYTSTTHTTLHTYHTNTTNIPLHIHTNTTHQHYDTHHYTHTTTHRPRTHTTTHTSPLAHYTMTHFILRKFDLSGHTHAYMTHTWGHIQRHDTHNTHTTHTTLTWKSSLQKKVRKTHLQSEKLAFLTFGCCLFTAFFQK